MDMLPLMRAVAHSILPSVEIVELMQDLTGGDHPDDVLKRWNMRFDGTDLIDLTVSDDAPKLAFVNAFSRGIHERRGDTL